MTSYNVTYQSIWPLVTSPTNAMFIEVAPVAEDQLHIEVAVIADGSSITLQGQGKATDHNYHFKVFFQPGDLAKPTSIALAADQVNDWDLCVVSGANGTTLYFLRTTTLTLTAEPNITVKLQKVGAAVSTGPRTTHIRFTWAPDIAETDPDGLDTATSSVEIVNFERKLVPPLSVGFDTTNQILSDGSYQNALVLRVLNLSSFPIVLEPTACRLTLSFELSADVNQRWALATPSQAGSFYVPGLLDSSGPDTGWSGPGGWQIKAAEDSVEWYVIPNSDNTALAAGASLEIPISNIVTGHPTGRTILRVQYQGLQEYDDGQFTVEIQKAPLRYSQTDSTLLVRSRSLSHLHKIPELRISVADEGGAIGTFSDHPFQLYTDSQSRLTLTTDGKLGIGTTTPAATLDVHGDARMRGDVNVSGALVFGSITRQMIDLYCGSYAIGVQPNTLYLRSDHDFAFFSGGVHSESPHDPGAGGRMPLVIQADGHIKINEQPPMVIQYYTKSGNGPIIETGWSSSDWYACIVGFNGKADGSIQGLNVWANDVNGKWSLCPYVYAANDTDWSVTVLFVRKELCRW